MLSSIKTIFDTRKAYFWILSVLAFIAGFFFSARYYTKAFSIVHLNLTVDRKEILEQAKKISEEKQIGPQKYHTAIDFHLDQNAKTFVELEAGGKEKFSQIPC